eukprot:13807550-Ditylum_brightwellii.AAC.1
MDTIAEDTVTKITKIARVFMEKTIGMSCFKMNTDGRPDQPLHKEMENVLLKEGQPSQLGNLNHIILVILVNSVRTKMIVGLDMPSQEMDFLSTRGVASETAQQ